MATINIAIEVQKQSVFAGKGWICPLFPHVSAATKDELQQKIINAIAEAAKEPEVGLAKVGKAVTVVVAHGGNTTTYTNDQHPDGVQPLRSTCFSNYSITEETERAVMHLLQHNHNWWEPQYVPPALPTHLIDSWKSWAAGVYEIMKARESTLAQVQQYIDQKTKA